MKWQYHQRRPELHSHEDIIDTRSGSGLAETVQSRLVNILLSDYSRFLLFIFLLIVPVYAMVKSFISHNWLMLIIDILLVPIGFVHGVLLLLGIVS